MAGQATHWRRLAAITAVVLALSGTSMGAAAEELWISHCAPSTSNLSVPPESWCIGGVGINGIPPTFAISASPTFLTVQTGKSATSTLTVVPWYGFQGQVTIAVALAPNSPLSTSMPMATFSNGLPETQSSAPYSGQALTFNVPATATIGEYHYTVQAASPQANPPYANGNIWLRVIGANNAGANDAGSCPDPACNFTSGGTVMSSAQVYVILWGSLFQTNSVDQLPASLDATARDLPGSQYAGRLSQYGVSLSYGASYVDTQDDSSLNNPLTDADLINEINRVNSRTGWGSGSANHIYVVVPEAGFSIKGTAGTGGTTCAYHAWNYSGSYAFIALPDFDNGNYFGVCVTNHTASPQNSDEEMLTHEVVEAATDPQVGPGWTDGGQELDDVCNWNSTLVSGVRYATAQEFYDKGAGQCMGQQERGYWITNSTGCVSSSGSAAWHGDMCSQALSRPASGIAAHPSGQGYWLVAQDGGVFSYGSAQFWGSLPQQGISPVAPVVGIASTPDGNGYWLVGADGGVFTYGNAAFLGSMGGKQLNAPIAGIATTPDGQGYWLVGQDGGVFSFGDALYFGNDVGNTFASCAHVSSDQWIGIATSPEGLGYWNVNTLGDISPHSNMPVIAGNPAPFFGSAVCESSAAVAGAAFNFDRWGALALDAKGNTYPAGNIPGPASGATGGTFVGLAFVR